MNVLRAPVRAKHAWVVWIRIFVVSDHISNVEDSVHGSNGLYHESRVSREFPPMDVDESPFHGRPFLVPYFEMYGFEYTYDGVYGGQPFLAYRSQGKDFRHREWYVGKY